jgi:hypothetical protein
MVRRMITAVTWNFPHWSPGLLTAVAWLGGGLLIGVLLRFTKWHKPNPNRAIPNPDGVIGQRNFFRRPSQEPGVMYTNVVGLVHFKSSAWYPAAVCGFFVAGVPAALYLVHGQLQIAALATAAGLLFVLSFYLRPKGAVQSCHVDPNGAITLIRGGVRILFDLNHFRYVRMHGSRSRTMTIPSMLVLYHHTEPSMWTWLRSVLLPEVDHERVVLFINSWRDSEGYFIGPRDMDGLFYQACVRAGRTPTARGNFFVPTGWEVHPN